MLDFEKKLFISIQLIFPRSKIIPDGLSQPRPELLAATMNVHVRKIKITDSKMVLQWISRNQKPVKQWIQSRVVEILRLTEPSK